MEKILRRDNGKRIRIVARLRTYGFGPNKKAKWDIWVETCEPRKRNFFSVYDHDSYAYRSMKPIEKTDYIKSCQLAHATREEIYSVMLEEWENLKPTIEDY